ncbi:MAG: thiamine phosphate synthase [Eubacterium sp.]|nr:thiamine phosphate synthase [Eubacterium sp.]
MNCKGKDLLLYAVTDRHWLGEGEPLIHQVEQAVRGGATFVQLREKELDEASFEAEGREILELCRAKGIPFVINDNVELAVRIGANGVHVGQSDMEAGHVRELIGPDRILGVSAETVEAAIRAEKAGADYLGVGAVFPTGSKDDAADVSLETLKAITEAVSIPVIAIGGITYENVSELENTGIVGIAVISAIFGQKDIEEATRKLREKTERLFSERM